MPTITRHGLPPKSDLAMRGSRPLKSLRSFSLKGPATLSSVTDAKMSELVISKAIASLDRSCGLKWISQGATATDYLRARSDR